MHAAKMTEQKMPEQQITFHPPQTQQNHDDLLSLSDDVYAVTAFYRFVDLPDYQDIQPKLRDFCRANNIWGTILVASEGVNGTIAAHPKDLVKVWEYLDADPRTRAIAYKLHACGFQPFERMKVRLKKEIVRLGVDDLDVLPNLGTYLKGEEWDKLIAEPDVFVVDTRNDYEVALGTFEGAVNPETDDFRSFPEWVEQNMDPEKHKKVAMFCTGGIRCEKSTALLKQRGFEDVYHLDGGILQYLEDTGNKSGKWQGHCFVFDDRVTLDDQLQPSTEYHCSSCGNDVSMDEIRWLSGNQKGVVCKNCTDDKARAEKVV